MQSLMDWKYPSFMKFVEEGMYTSNWGGSESAWAGGRLMELVIFRWVSHNSLNPTYELGNKMVHRYNRNLHDKI